MSYAVMPMDDYKAVCDNVRKKTNTNEAIRSGDIPDKIEQVYKAGQLSVMASSNAFKGSANGNPVTITDISSIEHNVGISVKSAPSDIQGGENLENTEFGYYKSLPFVLEKGKTYIVEIRNQHYDSWMENGYIEKSSWANDSSPIYNLAGAINIFTPTETAEYCVFLNLDISPAAKSQIFVGEEGQGGAEGVKVTVCGKNLFDYEKIMKKYAEGDFEKVNSYSVINIPLKPNTNYTVKINGEKNGAACFISRLKAVNSDAAAGLSVSTNWGTMERTLITDKSGNLYIGLYPIVAETRPAQFELAKVQIEEGTTATEYEEYREQTYISNAEGIVEGVKNIYPSMSISAEDSVTISAEYFKDIDKVLNNLAMNIALSGGN